LYSKDYQKTYVGFTSNLLERFKSHNSIGKKGWTIKYRPWIVIYTEFFKEKVSAMKKEKFLKSGVGQKMAEERKWRLSIKLMDLFQQVMKLRS
jgi:putative endonuclease